MKVICELNVSWRGRPVRWTLLLFCPAHRARARLTVERHDTRVFGTVSWSWPPVGRPTRVHFDEVPVFHAPHVHVARRRRP